MRIDRRRKLPDFPAKTWEQLYREEPVPQTGSPDVLMLADVFTNYGSPERGMAAIRVLRKVVVMNLDTQAGIAKDASHFVTAKLPIEKET